MSRRDVVNWYNKGIGLHRSGDYKKAIRCFDRALELNPEYAGVWNGKGAAPAGLRRHDEAARCYDRALELNPEDAGAWNNKGIALSNRGRYDEAVQCYDRTLEFNPEYAYAWSGKGFALAVHSPTSAATMRRSGAMIVRLRATQDFPRRRVLKCIPLL